MTPWVCVLVAAPIRADELEQCAISLVCKPGVKSRYLVCSSANDCELWFRGLQGLVRPAARPLPSGAHGALLVVRALSVSHSLSLTLSLPLTLSLSPSLSLSLSLPLC